MEKLKLNLNQSTMGFPMHLNITTRFGRSRNKNTTPFTKFNHLFGQTLSTLEHLISSSAPLKMFLQARALTAEKDGWY